jgi:uncharacterized membrane protein YkvA (DUF1232 family)
MTTTEKKWLLIAACIAYVICPLDFDFIPFLGWLDDLAVVLLTRRQVNQWTAAGAAEVASLIVHQPERQQQP